jgi:hypothetical protein
LSRIRRLPPPCGYCTWNGVHGILAPVTVDVVLDDEHLDEYHVVQRCDGCERFPDDEAAARALVKVLGLPESAIFRVYDAEQPAWSEKPLYYFTALAVSLDVLINPKFPNHGGKHRVQAKRV